MIGGWLAKLFHRTPAAPPPVSRTPSPVSEEKADLEFVGTQQLYAEIASRYDGSMLVCVRQGVRDAAGATAVFLSHNVDQPADFLRRATVVIQDLPKREIRDGDL